MNSRKFSKHFIACSFTIILFWIFLGFQYAYDSKQAHLAAETAVSNLSKAFEENMVGTIRHLDEFLVTIRRDYQQNQDHFTTLIESYNRHSERELIIQLSITDAQGIMVYSSKGMPEKPLDLSDREHFRVHLASNEDKLFISKPVLGRVSKKWSIQFTRKIVDRNGNFAGVAILSVDPDYFSSFYRSIDIGAKGVISLVGMDGVIRARSSAAWKGRDPVGMVIPKSDVQIDPAKPPVGIYYAPSQVDGINRVVSYRRLKNYPLVVRVALADEETFNSLYWHRNNMIVQGVLASGGLLLIFWLVQRLNLRQQQYTQELETVNNSLHQQTHELGDINEQLELEAARRQRAQEELAVKQIQLESINSSLQQRVQDAVMELRQKDQVMISQGRQASMGEMVGNIAHQWRQPLNALAMVLGNIKSAYQYDELTPEYLDKTVENGNRLLQKMSSTINDFSRFFRPNKEVVLFSACEQISQAVALVETGLKCSNIAITLETPEDVMLTGFPNEYSQVLLNILSNARDAIEEAGVAEGSITVRLYNEDNDFGVVSVSDNGGGIPSEVIEKVFDPYFSTKKVGTGIGLYMSKMIIERSMNGTIEACNRADGAELLIKIPIGRSEG